MESDPYLVAILVFLMFVSVTGLCILTIIFYVLVLDDLRRIKEILGIMD